MVSYETKAGDTADEIAFRYYGSPDASYVEQLLEANPGLADAGPELPAGMTLTMPDIVTPAVTEGVRLWD